MNRREFVTRSVGAAALLAASSAVRADNGPAAREVGALRGNKREDRKFAVVQGMLSGDGTPEEKAKLAKRVGIDGVELGRMSIDDGKRWADAMAAEGLRAHSILHGWEGAFGTTDADGIAASTKAVEESLRLAAAVGADDILLVPAIVNADISYGDAYRLSIQNIKPLVPLAGELGVVIAMENVWNNFLLSPIEFARYVDEYDSPWVRAYLDVANMVKFGWPEQWVPELGPRIAKVHLKDYKRDGAQWPMLREGDIDWPRLMGTFDDVAYFGWFTAELGGGDEDYLRDVVARVKLIFAGE
jgi:L-ribulose-5-phosphate 3-epimerase